jgi:hypothetical protein
MNNEPVAYIDPYDLERLPHYDCHIGSQKMKNGIPLYTHPADESFDRTASHMAGEYVSYPAKTLTDEEIHDLIVNKVTDYDMIKQALRKAQEK